MTNINGIYFSDSNKDKRIAREHFSRFNGHTSSIYDAYERPSRTKASIMEYRKNNAYNLGATSGLEIMSHNCMSFTLGFTFVNPETGKKCFAYITKDYNRYCEIDG